MPRKPMIPCSEPGCPNLCNAGEKYCEQHAPLHKGEFRKLGFAHEDGESSAKRGYGYRWRKERAAFLQAHPLCEMCRENGRYVKAEVVDHRIPHKGDKRLFWDKKNWQSLCKKCHATKTFKEDVNHSDRQTPVYDYPWRRREGSEG